MAERPAFWHMASEGEFQAFAAILAAKFVGADEVGVEGMVDALLVTMPRRSGISDEELGKLSDQARSAYIKSELAGEFTPSAAGVVGMREAMEALSEIDFTRIVETRNKLAFVGEMGRLYPGLRGSELGGAMCDRMLEASTASIEANMLLFPSHLVIRWPGIACPHYWSWFLWRITITRRLLMSLPPPRSLGCLARTEANETSGPR